MARVAPQALSKDALSGSATDRPCLWCGTPFTPNRHGSPQVFCAPACRSAFHTAGRRWAENAVRAGRLSVAELQNGFVEACTPATARESPVPVPDSGPNESALYGLLNRFHGPIDVLIAVATEGIVEMVRLGWLDQRRIRSPVALSDALTALASAALDERLRPARG